MLPQINSTAFSSWVSFRHLLRLVNVTSHLAHCASKDDAHRSSSASDQSELVGVSRSWRRVCLWGRLARMSTSKIQTSEREVGANTPKHQRSGSVAQCPGLSQRHSDGAHMTPWLLLAMLSFVAIIFDSRGMWAMSTRNDFLRGGSETFMRVLSTMYGRRPKLGSTMHKSAWWKHLQSIRPRGDRYSGERPYTRR